ncbi:MAG: hypothetical protein IPP40_14565 [bacterium]|nr:hypothetical protein [bacterium]
MKCDFLQTRILSLFNLLKRVGFAVLLLGDSLLALAQPYEPTFLLDITGEVNQVLGFNLQVLGDQNGDGFDDFVTSVASSENTAGLRIYYGNNNGQQSFIEFGRFDSTERSLDGSDADFDAGLLFLLEM